MDEFDTLDSEELKVEYLLNLLKPVAESTDGRLRHAQSDEEVHCTGKYMDRPVKIIMDTSTGGLKVELKLKNSAGTVELNYDPEASGEEDDIDPEWENGGEQRYFIEPFFYLEDYKGKLEEQKKVLGMIEPGILGRVKSLMKRLGIGWVNVDAAVLRCGLFESLFDAAAILEIVDTLNSFAMQFEKGGEIVAPRPSVTLGGVAVNPELVAEIIECPYCRTNVTVKRDRKCPNCGTAL